jgi:Obg family GTPase CgtA
MTFAAVRNLHRCLDLSRRRLLDGANNNNMLVAATHPFRAFQRRCVSVDISKAMHENTTNSNKRKKKVKERRDSGRASYRFVDRTRVQVSGGIGGKGSLSLFHIGRKHHRRPDGGHGGNGGSVVIVADPNEQSLRWTHPHVMAEAGAHGSSQSKLGRKGLNTVLKVPCGVVVRRVLEFDEEWDPETKMVRKLYVEENELGDGEGALVEENPFRHRTPNQPYLASNDYDSDDDESNDEDVENDSVSYDGYLNEDEASSMLSAPVFTPWGEREKVVVATLDEPGTHVVVARGGRGGTGSGTFASLNGPTPQPEILAKYATPEAGESAFLELELKLIADVGLVGFPNAGKSSLLTAMSRATPHVAPYPFTTLSPLVGYIEYKDGFRVCAADIPGLIAGASEGRGRGHDFLRHLERTKALLYMVDVAGVDGRDPREDLQVLIDELAAYGDGSLLDRNALIVANKIDLLDEAKCDDIVQDLHNIVQDAGLKTSGDILGISAGVTGVGLSTLSRAIRDIVVKSSAVLTG